ncbi:MAG TPA: Calx-beta domain-containing protein [Fibrella sp.]
MNPITDVKFGGASVVAAGGTFNIVDNTTLTVLVPSNAVTGPISIVSQRGGDGPNSTQTFTVDAVSDGGIKFATPTPTYILPENADIPQNNIARTLLLEPAKQQAPGNPEIAPLSNLEVEITIAASAVVFSRRPIIVVENTRTGEISQTNGKVTVLFPAGTLGLQTTYRISTIYTGDDAVEDAGPVKQRDQDISLSARLVKNNNDPYYSTTGTFSSTPTITDKRRDLHGIAVDISTVLRTSELGDADPNNAGVAEFVISPTNLDFLDPFGPDMFSYGDFDNTALGEGELYGATGPDDSPKNLDPRPDSDVLVNLQSSRPNEGLIRYFVDDQDNDGAGPDRDTDGPNARTPIQPIPQANQVVLFAVDETSNEFYRNRHIIQVVGQDDTGFDGDQVYQIVAESVFSADPEFSGATLDRPVTLVNTDDESNTTQGNQPGFVFSPPNQAGQPVTFAAPSGLQTNENGSTAIFTVKLNKQPTANVTLTLNSQDVTEGLLIDPVTGNQVQQITLTFTPNTPPAGSPANVSRWDIQQTVTVKGQDDTLRDGDQAYFLETESSSADVTYDQIDPPDILITNTDNEAAGVTVTPTLLIIPEGQSRTFSVVLNLQPTSDVFINLRSSSAEGTINKTRLTFTPANWNIPQTVTVTAKDDIVDDTDANFQIILDPALSSDANYNGIDPQDVNVVNLNDDNVGITVTPSSGLTTRESGSTTSFTVRLNSPPTSDVTLSYTSNDVSEGLLATNLDPTPRQTVQLIFTATNYNQPQTVTVIGQDDTIQDGDIQYLVLANDSVSSDTKYNGLKSSDVSVTNLDNEVAGLTVTPFEGLITSESGTAATFTVRLNLRPTANVTIPVSSSDTSEGTVAPTTLTFTSTNFANPQTVTVRGVDDLVRDGNVDYTIVFGPATSTDPQYNGLDAEDVTATNLDDETPDIVITPVSGLETTEAGTTATFTVRLSSPPTSTVTINLSSSDTSEGTVTPSSLTFTSANFNVPRTVTVKGVDDTVDDGDVAYSIVTAPATSTDPDYDGRNAPDVTLINRDDEAPGLLITPTALTVNENRGTATFTVRLVTKPIANVTIPVASSDTNQGTVAPTTLTFTPTDFDQAQTVTITIPDDRIDEDTAVFNVQLGPTTSTDTDYSGLISQVRVTVIDNDTASVIITPATSLTNRLRTTEANGVNKRATFQVRLNSQPTSQVTIALSSSDTTEGALINPIDNLPSTSNSRTLVFDATNFGTPQTVTIEGVDDNLDDGDVAYSIITAPAQSNDANYNTLNPADVLANNVDNDTGGILIRPTTSLTVRERGNSDTFTAVLTSQPLNTVVFSLSSSDTTEGVPSANRLVFAASNWNVPQTVTVRPLDDLVDDDNQTFKIITGPAVASGDKTYNGLDPADVDVTNIDDDAAGLSVTPNSSTTNGLLTTREGGGSVSFAVKLLSQPTANVTVTVSTDDATEGMPLPANTSVTFTPASYNEEQTLIVNGVDDTVEDGHINYTISIAVTNGDAKYTGQSVPDFAARNLDNDDNTKPNVAITSPTANQVFRSITSVFGTASDARDPASFFVSGIKRVEVQLVRYDDPTTPASEVGYYNTVKQQFELPRNTATTNNPQLLPATYNALRQAWVANLPQTTTNSLAEGLYAVVAYATDGKDNRQISEAVNFRVDMTPPVVAITTPVDGATLNTLPRATGTASDAGGSGVERVEVTVIRQANSANGLAFGYLAKDGSFTSTFTVANNRLPATLSGSNWAASLPTLPRATYTITAYAFDNSGRGSAPDTHRFTITGTNEFAGNTSFLISLPYMDGASVNATTTPTKAFTVPPTDPTTGRVNYRLQRYNPLTMDWETLGNGSTLRRGEGYLLTPVASGVSIKRPSDDPTRIPLDTDVQEFQVTLRNQPSLAPDADGNGWNLIGDPFNPALFSSAEWLNARVTANIGGQTFTGTVAEAADRGILDRRLFNYNPSAATSGDSLYTPVSGDLLPFRGYFVRTFVDGVQVNLRAVSR